METKELDIKKNTLEQQAAKLRKQRRRQMLASTFGIIILLAYNPLGRALSDWNDVLQLQDERNKQRRTDRTIHLAGKSPCFGIYKEGVFHRTSDCEERRHTDGS